MQVADDALGLAVQSVAVAPFIINYSGCIFREYPGPWQVILPFCPCERRMCEAHMQKFTRMGACMDSSTSSSSINWVVGNKLVIKTGRVAGGQVMLRQDNREYACIAEDERRYNLGEAKEELMAAMGLDTEEEGSALQFLRRGYRVRIWLDHSDGALNCTVTFTRRRGA
jgi:hypothetical protein